MRIFDDPVSAQLLPIGVSEKHHGWGSPSDLFKLMPEEQYQVKVAQDLQIMNLC